MFPLLFKDDFSEEEVAILASDHHRKFSDAAKLFMTYVLLDRLYVIGGVNPAKAPPQSESANPALVDLLEAANLAAGWGPWVRINVKIHSRA